MTQTANPFAKPVGQSTPEPRMDLPAQPANQGSFQETLQREPAEPVNLTAAAGPVEPAADRRQIESLLYRNIDDEASDLHLSIGTTPWQGIHGKMQRMEDASEIDAPSMHSMLQSLRSEDDWDKFLAEKRLDFSHETPRSRFRCHYGVANSEPYGVFRTISNTITPFADLGLPPIVRTFADWESGLVIFIGVTNSGKSSSLTALVDIINDEQAKKIIGIESPVEALHKHKKSMVIQREVGRDVDSFAIGIEDAMREAPHVILVGELRDQETMSAAISAATSGHLVFATMHAESTADAPTRILDSIPAAKVDEVRSSLSRSLKAVVYQKLLPIKGGGGRALAAEVLIVDSAISNMIRQNKLEGIQAKLMDTSSGCISFERSLLKLVNDGIINERTAERAELRPGSYKRLKDAR